ncbi:glycosyltransferase [Winogradskyella sp. DF17]|uniref:Glycosyltransferase n=1 Tax=Winogradskyella pelagia TaxID=2819984 RepID=A0ABS3T2F3_9FLAO|nr:glycosyltransferase [Winogradskyella sp. DF17]MBO3116902.1 glycosyltransferase [Winogradskyella sp. DF17]
MKKNLSILAINMYYGGAQRVISMLLKHMVKDYNVHLVIFTEHINFEIPEEVELKILFPESNERNTVFNKLKNVFRAAKAYDEFIKEKQIDVSLSFLALPNIINGIVRAKNKNLRTVISERCFPSIMYKANKSSQLLSKFVIPKYYNKNDALFSNSININEDLRDNFKVNIPMSVIYNPINSNSTKYIDSASIAKTAQLKLINVGNIYDAKNQKLIIKALSQLPKNSFYYTQAGTGVLEESLKALSKSCGLDNQITFLGNTTQVEEHLLQQDCFVLSSKTEGFPNVVLEALSCGLPVISTNCKTGPLELLNDNERIDIPKGGFAEAKYGLLIRENDAIGLASALDFFLKHPEKRKQYSKLGYKRSKDYALPVIYKQIKTLLEE